MTNQPLRLGRKTAAKEGDTTSETFNRLASTQGENGKNGATHYRERATERERKKQGGRKGFSEVCKCRFQRAQLFRVRFGSAPKLTVLEIKS